MTRGYTTLEAASPALVTAPVIRRFLAFLVDVLVEGAWAAVVFLAFGEEIFSLHRDIPAGVFLMNAAMATIYSVMPVVIWGGTPGKLVMGIYIGTEHGSRISVWQATLRYVAFSGFFITYAAKLFSLALTVALNLDMLWSVISLVMMFVDQKGHRALHDRIAGTRVLRGRLPGPADLRWTDAGAQG